MGDKTVVTTFKKDYCVLVEFDYQMLSKLEFLFPGFYNVIPATTLF